MNSRTLMTLLAAVALIGWTSAATATDLTTVLEHPDRFLGQRIAITAPVVENSAPTGAEFKRWSFTAGSSDHKLSVSEAGFNPATIMDAHGLVEQARRAGDEITVAGTLKTAESELIMKMDSVLYGDTRINTDEGPFVDEFYGDCYPGTPLFYDGHLYYPGEFPY